MSDKKDFTIYLKYFIFPVIFITLIAIINLLLIMPYLNIKSELDSTRDGKNLQITNYQTKLNILQNARDKADDLNRYEEKMVELVPNDESPAPLVANLGAEAEKFNFNKIDENKNIADQNLSNQGVIEVRFNGRTVGPLSALNYLTSLNSNKGKIINIRDLELFDDRDNKYYRVSFVARTVFNKTKVQSSIDAPINDILNDMKFTDFINRYLEETVSQN